MNILWASYAIKLFSFIKKRVTVDLYLIVYK